MTIHNRREKSLQALNCLYAQDALPKFAMEIIILDDGSTDGSTAAIKNSFPAVQIIQGDGSHFWNRGMHLIFGEALQQDFDFYLWLNDDTFLYPDALRKMWHTWQNLDAKSIIAGSTQDPDTQATTYGGFIRASRLTLKLHEVGPQKEARSITTMHGNCVLIPKAVSDVVGNIEPVYRHRWGDPDYGLRARKWGCEVYLAAGYIGTCPANPLAEAWTDAGLSFRERLADFHSIKGYGRKDWFFYVRRHGGVLWPLLWLKPYFDMLVSSLRYRLSPKSAS